MLFSSRLRHKFSFRYEIAPRGRYTDKILLPLTGSIIVRLFLRTVDHLNWIHCQWRTWIREKRNEISEQRATKDEIRWAARSIILKHSRTRLPVGWIEVPSKFVDDHLLYTPVICQWCVEHISSRNFTDAFTATLAGFVWASTHRSSLSSPLTSYSYLNGMVENSLSPLVHKCNYIVASALDAGTQVRFLIHCILTIIFTSSLSTRPSWKAMVFILSFAWSLKCWNVEYPIWSSRCHHLPIIHAGCRS